MWKLNGNAAHVSTSVATFYRTLGYWIWMFTLTKAAHCHQFIVIKTQSNFLCIDFYHKMLQFIVEFTHIEKIIVNYLLRSNIFNNCQYRPVWTIPTEDFTFSSPISLNCSTVNFTFTASMIDHEFCLKVSICRNVMRSLSCSHRWAVFCVLIRRLFCR